MTKRQKQVLDFVEAYIAKHKFAPSYDEITEAMGLKSKSNVHRILHALMERQHLIFLPHRARSIVLLDEVGSPAYARGYQKGVVDTLNALEAGK